MYRFRFVAFIFCFHDLCCSLCLEGNQTFAATNRQFTPQFFYDTTSGAVYVSPGNSPMHAPVSPHGMPLDSAGYYSGPPEMASLPRRSN